MPRLSPARSSATGCLCFSGAVRAANSKGRAFWALAQAFCAAEFHSVDTMDVFISGGFMALNQMIWPLPLQEPPVLLGGWSLGARPARHLAEALERAGCLLRGLFTLDERLIAERRGNSSTPSIGSELSAFHVALRGEAGSRFRLRARRYQFNCPRFQELQIGGVDYLRSSASDVLLQRAAALTAEVCQLLRCGEGRHFDLGVSHSWDISQQLRGLPGWRERPVSPSSPGRRCLARTENTPEH